MKSKDINNNEGHWWRDKIIAPVLVGTLLCAGKKIIDWASKELKGLWNKCKDKLNGKAEKDTPESKLKEETTDMSEEEICPVVGKLICKGETALVFGASDTGKSRIVSQWAAALAGGTNELSVPNHPIADHPQHVFYYDTQGQTMIRTRLMKAFSQKDAAFMHYLTPKNGISTLEDICNNIEMQISQCGGDCTVVIDNLSTFTEITKPDKVIDFLENRLKQLKTIKQKQGHYLTIILLSHTTKAAADPHKSLAEPDVAGASQLFKLCDCVWAVELSRVQCPAEDGKEDYLRILKPLVWKHGNKNFVYLLQPEGEGMGFHFKYKCTSNEEDALKGKLEQPCVNTNVKDEAALQPVMSARTCKKQKRSNAPISEKIKKEIRQLFKKKKPMAEIAELCNVSRPTVYKYTKDLREKQQRA